jgi:ABC-type phosphate transport system permease subunit
MRDLLAAVISVVGGLWVVAVLFGLIAKPLNLTTQRSLVGRLARACRAIALLSP